MGIRNKIKKRLPIFGAGAGTPARPATAAPAADAASTTWSEPANEEVGRGDDSVDTFLADFVKSNTIAVFMKGSPEQPMCGFSANAAGILRSYGKPLAHFNVLSDPEVRQGIKEFSQWPTIPQIYIGGEFLGGSDILMQMHQSGELKQAIDEAFSAAAAAD
jgi:monothiol glutaredoxin